MPILKNDEKMYVYLQGSHFQQNNVLASNNDHVINNNVINSYIVYKLDPIASSRDATFTIQNALFGAMQITKNVDTSKYDYKGYGICFDEGGQFGHTTTEGDFAHTTNARNVLIFRVDMSFSVHANNRANHIYVRVQNLFKALMILQFMQKKTFIETLQILVILHYNGNNSYLFVNGRQELTFKYKTDQLVRKKLCIGNLSDQWTTSESEKTGLYGKIYDFVVDYEEIVGTTKILDIHKYLMIKHSIIP